MMIYINFGLSRRDERSVGDEGNGLPQREVRVVSVVKKCSVFKD